MKRLILVRHAKSGHKDGSLADFDRPLNRRGKEDAVKMGRRLAQRGIAPDALVTSPAERARATAERLAEELEIPEDRLHFESPVYEADAEDLLDVVRAFDDAWQSVLLVGHNPGFHELAEALGDLSLEKLPTCAAVGLDFVVEQWSQVEPGGGTLAFFETPRKSGAAP